ncbi:MAG: acyl-CoA dehydrogenase family protein [Pseudomonadales bacterium]|nr:acyl-CoA dehydrogenase family protein [Pseudomonadales bacterium]
MQEESIVDVARTLKPLIVEQRNAGEKRARLMPEVVEAVGKAGFFRLFAPQEVGGLEVSLTDAFAATVEISSADPAVGWYMVNSMGACMMSAKLPEEQRNTLFAEPDRNFGFSAVALARAKPTEGGFLLNGSWPVVTGCEDSKWCALMGMATDGEGIRMLNGRPDVRFFLVPTAELKISQTWQNAAAMRGTGSNQADAENLFVPDVMAVSPADELVINRPVFRTSGIVTLPIFAAVAIGVLKGALESATTEIKAKVSSMTGKALKDQVETQIAVADADAAMRAILAGCLAATRQVDARFAVDEALSDEEKAAVYASGFYAGDVARQVISNLYTKGSRAAFMQGHALERSLANIHAIISAIDARRSLHHASGGILLGNKPTEPGW